LVKKNLCQIIKNLYNDNKNSQFNIQKTSSNIRLSSDVDIAIYLPENMNKIDMFDHQLKLITELENFYKKRVDLVILNKTLSLFFKYIILKEGKLIYNANIGKHADYFCKIFNLYFDYKPFQDQFNKHYVQRNI